MPKTLINRVGITFKLFSMELKTNLNKVEKNKFASSEQAVTTPQASLAEIMKEFELIELEERLEMVQAAAADVVRCTNEGCNGGCGNDVDVA